MPLVEKDPVDDPLHRLIQRRILKHNVRRLPPQLQRHLLLRARQRPHNKLAHLRAPRERHLRCQRMIDYRRPRLTHPAHNVHHPWRQPRLLADLPKLQRRQTRRLRRLQHHTVPCSQRRRNLPRQHQQREIPRNHLPYHPIRRHLPPRCQIRQLVRPTRMIKEMRRRHRNVKIPTLLDRLAPIHRLRHRKLPRMILQQPRDPIQILPSFSSGHLPPNRRKSLLRRLARRIHIRRITQRNVRNLHLIPRIDRRKILPLLRRHKLPVDEQIITFLQLRIRRLRRRIILPKIAKNEFTSRVSFVRRSCHNHFNTLPRPR